MRSRDRLEAVLRSWDRYETERGAPPVIDFDCHPASGAHVTPVGSRLEVRAQLVALLAEAGPGPVHDRGRASLAYLDALLGARAPLAEYLRATQGSGAAGWPEEYAEHVREVALAELARLDVGWGPATMTALAATEGVVAPADAADLIRQCAGELEADVRRFTGADAPFRLRVEHVDLDVYWAYWLDGAGEDVRMRINVRHAVFTHVQARQFALHEVLGHGLQSASWSQECRSRDVPWVRVTSVHAQHQVLMEGLAQALPLFVRPADQPLVARVRLAHYLQLVRAALHLAVNAGTPVAECVAFATARVPFWSGEHIGDALTDRGADPLLRSYLWAYPAGLDWFVRLADEAPAELAIDVHRAAYRAPLTPDELVALWPGGPVVGGWL